MGEKKGWGEKCKSVLNPLQEPEGETFQSSAVTLAASWRYIQQEKKSLSLDSLHTVLTTRVSVSHKF